VTYQTAYEAFGNQTATSGSTLDRQKANTKELAPTGLLNEGFRYRDPDTGTFLTRDPLFTKFMMGIDKWYLDGKKVSKREYQRAIAPIIFDLESHPDKVPKSQEKMRISIGLFIRENTKFQGKKVILILLLPAL
jgi:hypothetical protein